MLWVSSGDANKNGGVAAIVIGDEERRGIGINECLAVADLELDDEDLALALQVFSEASHEFFRYAESRSAVREALFDAGERQRDLADGFKTGSS